MKELLKKKVLKSNLCRLSKSLHCKFLFKNLVSSLLGIGRLKLIQSGRCFLWLLFRYFKKDKAIVLIYSYESLLQYISQLLLACFGFVCLFVVLHRNNSGLDSTRKNLGWGKDAYTVHQAGLKCLQIKPFLCIHHPHSYTTPGKSKEYFNAAAT